MKVLIIEDSHNRWGCETQVFDETTDSEERSRYLVDLIYTSVSAVVFKKTLDGLLKRTNRMEKAEIIEGLKKTLKEINTVKSKDTH